MRTRQSVSFFAPESDAELHELAVEELKQLQAQKEKLEEEIRVLLLPKDELQALLIQEINSIEESGDVSEE